MTGSVHTCAWRCASAGARRDPEGMSVRVSLSLSLSLRFVGLLSHIFFLSGVCGEKNNV